jgi:hypothetical protein
LIFATAGAEDALGAEVGSCWTVVVAGWTLLFPLSQASSKSTAVANAPVARRDGEARVESFDRGSDMRRPSDEMSREHAIRDGGSDALLPTRRREGDGVRPGEEGVYRR